MSSRKGIRKSRKAETIRRIRRESGKRQKRVNAGKMSESGGQLAVRVAVGAETCCSVESFRETTHFEPRRGRAKMYQEIRAARPVNYRVFRPRVAFAVRKRPIGHSGVNTEALRIS